MASLNLFSIKPNRQEKYSRTFSLINHNKIAVFIDGCIRIIPFEIIEFVEASSNYCYLHLIDGSKILLTKTLKSILEGLNNSFLKIHKSYIVNLEHIHLYKIKENQVQMASSKIVKVSRSNKANLRAILM